jgi:FOG: EAL domain
VDYAYTNNSVLVVDDQPFALELNSQILIHLGFRHIKTASTVSDALSILSSPFSNISLILSDLNMPGEDGLDFLRHLEALNYRGGIILCSGVSAQGMDTAKVIAQSRNLSVLATLIKPLHPDQLKAALEKHDFFPEVHKGCGASINISPNMLRQALAAGHINAWYQPKISARDASISGFEALARWTDPVIGIIGPDAFIPIAEQHSIIDDLTFSIAEQASKNNALWQRQGFDTGVAINVSMKSLHKAEFYDRLTAAIQKHDSSLNLDCFQIEVTESQLTDDPLLPLETLLRLHMKKVSLLIDDFGTGHATLDQLKNLPFDGLKIDKTFIHSSRDSKRAQVIIKSSLQMAAKLSMYTVAEGVETPEDWKRVVDLGFDFVQGYLIAKPMPGHMIADWITQWDAGKKNFLKGI